MIQVVRAMMALEMKNWMICGDNIEQALDVCVKREEDRNTAQHIRGNIRQKLYVKPPLYCVMSSRGRPR